jgi:hypothetical protein
MMIGFGVIPGGGDSIHEGPRGHGKVSLKKLVLLDSPATCKLSATYLGGS